MDSFSNLAQEMPYYFYSNKRKKNCHFLMTRLNHNTDIKHINYNSKNEKTRDTKCKAFHHTLP